jgi:hypothetical protein
MSGSAARKNKNLLAAGLACALAASCIEIASATTAAGPDIDLIRLQASYDNGPKRVKDQALDTYLSQIARNA